MHTYVHIEMKLLISGSRKNLPALTPVRQKPSGKRKQILNLNIHSDFFRQDCQAKSHVKIKPFQVNEMWTEKVAQIPLSCSRNVEFLKVQERIHLFFLFGSFQGLKTEFLLGIHCSVFSLFFFLLCRLLIINLFTYLEENVQSQQISMCPSRVHYPKMEPSF